MRSRTYVLAFVILLLVYIVLTFGLPVNQETLQRYNLTESKVRLINLSVVIPLIIIWLIALYGFLNLRKYAHAVSDTKEGKAFHYLSLGLVVLGFSLPLNAILASTARYISTTYVDLAAPVTITRNHLAVLFSLCTFLLLAKGATELMKTIKKQPQGVPNAFAIGLISLSAMYAWLITAKPLNQGDGPRIYYLPEWLLIFTIVIPYLVAWRAGSLATYYLYKFHQNVKGVIYKSAFKDLATGIGVVVGVAVLVQLITTSSGQFSRLNLTPLLMVVYGLLLMYVVGFGLVARGAKKLKKLEEV